MLRLIIIATWRLLKLKEFSMNSKFKKVYGIIEMIEIGWSVCVPHSCSRDDILGHFEKTIKDLGEGLELAVDLNENFCSSVLDEPEMTAAQYATLTIFGLFLVVGTISSIIDIQYRGENESVFLETFSTYKNVQRVMKTGTARKELDFLYGMRIFSACYVVIGHRYIMNIMFPVINQLEELEWIERYSSTLILGSTVSVDSFFMASGMLVSIGFFEYVTKTGEFNLFSFYIHRYLRITLPLSLVILFYCTLPQFLGTGPMLYQVHIDHQKYCQEYWWSTLLHIQAFVNPDKLCIYPVWYLSNEMPFYFLSPVILYPLWKYPKLGYWNIFVLFTLSTISSFYFAWINEYDGQMLPITCYENKLQAFDNLHIKNHNN